MPDPCGPGAPDSICYGDNRQLQEDEEYSDGEYNDEEYNDGDDKEEHDDDGTPALSGNDIRIVLDGSVPSSLKTERGGEEADEERVNRKVEERAKREAEERAKSESVERARKEAEEQAKREAEEETHKEASEVGKIDVEKIEVGETEGKAPGYGSTQLRQQAKNVLLMVKATRRMSWQESADAYHQNLTVSHTMFVQSPEHGKLTAMTRKGDKWRKVRVHLQDQHTMAKKLWKHTMDKDDTGLIGFHEFRVYVKLALHNVDFQFFNRFDERLQAFFLRLSQSEHINGARVNAVAKWRSDRALNFIDEHGLMKDPAWPFYRSNSLRPINGQKLLELMDMIKNQWTLEDDAMLQSLVSRYKNPNPLQKRSKVMTIELWNAIDKKMIAKNREECRFRVKFFKLETSLHENAFISYLFNLFDPNDSGMLAFDEFVQGCMRHGLDSYGRLGTCNPCPGADKKGYPKHHGDVVGPLAYNMVVQEGPEKRKHLLSFNSLGCLSHTNPFRRMCLRVTKLKAFDMVVLVAILFNSIVLTIEDYQDPDRENNPTPRNQIVDSSETFFTAIFTFECFLKIIALGFVSFPTAYMKDNWNAIDFIVVASGIVGMIPGFPQLSSLRTVKVLRPLRSISRLPGMRKLVGALLNALPGLFTCVMLLMGCFTIFGILGVQLWQGKLHFACRKSPFPVGGEWEYADEVRVCSAGGSGFQCWNGTWCGSEHEPPAGHPMAFPLRLPPGELNFGLTNFDNIGLATITIFQVITMENWSVIMYFVQVRSLHTN
jgi:hypothetical protein